MLSICSISSVSANCGNDKNVGKECKNDKKPPTVIPSPTPTIIPEPTPTAISIPSPTPVVIPVVVPTPTYIPVPVQVEEIKSIPVEPDKTPDPSPPPIENTPDPIPEYTPNPEPIDTPSPEPTTTTKIEYPIYDIEIPKEKTTIINNKQPTITEIVKELVPAKIVDDPNTMSKEERETAQSVVLATIIINQIIMKSAIITRRR